MTTREVIQLAGSRDSLNEFFTLALAEQPQDIILIKEDINLKELLNKLNANDLLVSNENYRVEKADYSVLTKNGEILFSVARNKDIDLRPDEYYVERPDELVETFRVIQDSSRVLTCSLED